MDESTSKTALLHHAERMQKRLETIRSEADQIGTRAMNVGEFVGGVAASSAYRAYLNKKGQPMPKLMGFDADTVTGAALVILGFFEVIPEKYADHAIYLGAGLVSGAVGNKVAGIVNEKIATKGDFVSGHHAHQLSSGDGDVSAHRGATILEMIRQSALVFFRESDSKRASHLANSD